MTTATVDAEALKEVLCDDILRVALEDLLGFGQCFIFLRGKDSRVLPARTMSVSILDRKYHQVLGGKVVASFHADEILHLLRGTPADML